MAKSALTKVSTTKLLNTLVNFAVIDATARSVSNLQIPGVPPIATQVFGLSINAARLGLVSKMTKDLPAPIPGLASAYAKLSLTQQTLALLPSLASGFLPQQ